VFATGPQHNDIRRSLRGISCPKISPAYQCTPEKHSVAPCQLHACSRSRVSRCSIQMRDRFWISMLFQALSTAQYQVQWRMTGATCNSVYLRVAHSLSLFIRLLKSINHSINRCPGEPTDNKVQFGEFIQVKTCFLHAKHSLRPPHAFGSHKDIQSAERFTTRGSCETGR